MANNTLIPLDSASVIAAPSTPNANYSDPTSVLHNATWLLADDEPGYWTASFSFTFTPARLRLWNANVDGSGTKSFSLTPLSTSSLSNLSFVDSATSDIVSCSSVCPLAMGYGADYQDFFFVNSFSMNAFRLDIKDWYGSGGGLAGLQLFGEAQTLSTSSSISSSTSATSIPSPTSSTPPASTNSTLPKNNTTLSGGAIAGIVIGVIALVAIAAAIFLIWRRKSRRTRQQQPNEKFVPIGGRHEVDADDVDRARYRIELDGNAVSELDAKPDRQKMEKQGGRMELEDHAIHEVPGDLPLK